MHVDIIEYPETLVATLEHRGPEKQTYKTSAKFTQWRKENAVPETKEILTGFITQTLITLALKTFAWSFVSL